MRHEEQLAVVQATTTVLVGKNQRGEAVDFGARGTRFLHHRGSSGLETQRRGQVSGGGCTQILNLEHPRGFSGLEFLQAYRFPARVLKLQVDFRAARNLGKLEKRSHSSGGAVAA